MVQKAFAVLECFAASEGFLNYREICARLTLPRSTIHRLLTDLKEIGYVVQDSETGKYGLGIRLFEIGMRAVVQRGLTAAIRPFMEKLARVSGETINLGVLTQDYEVLYVEKVESSNAVRVDRPVGARDAAYCTALGKILLAYLPEQEIEEYLASVKITQHGPNTIMSAGELRQHLSLVRSRGVARDNRESYPDLSCVAAPIRDRTGKVIAAVSISGPSTRLGSERQDEIEAPLVEICACVSRGLGYTSS